MKMLIASNVQKLTDPPKAARHAPITAAYISALIAFPPSSSATRRAGPGRRPHRGRRALDRRQRQLAHLRDAEDDAEPDRDHDDRDQEHLDDGAGRDLAGLQRRRRERDRDPEQQDLGHDVADVDQQPAGGHRGREVDALALQEADLRGHAADRRHREVRERHRELELGGADQRQVDRHRAHRAIAVAKFVSSEMNIATASHQKFGVLDRVVERLRVPDLREQAKTAMSVPIAISRLVPLTR